MLRLVHSSFYGTHGEMEGQLLCHESFLKLCKLATEQAVMGLVSQGLINSGVRLEHDDALNLYALHQSIRLQNHVMDEAVVRLCNDWNDAGIRILIIKGQTLAALYPDPGLRQSGDIDFLIHPEDWEKAMTYVREVLKMNINDSNSEKHVEWVSRGVQYEMHKFLTTFAYPKHHHYWEKVVLPEIWNHPYTIRINGCEVPTLAPTYNVLYTFVHIFYHLILDGIGMRQFCDWARILSVFSPHKADSLASIDTERKVNTELLERHLKGIGLRKAFTGLGAILTEYIGLPEKDFPFEITAEDLARGPQLFRNMITMGNLGHNVPYKNKPGIKHGIEHLSRITKQAQTFYHYAPVEVWWRIPNMFKWWSIKIKRLIYKG